MCVSVRRSANVRQISLLTYEKATAVCSIVTTFIALHVLIDQYIDWFLLKTKMLSCTPTLSLRTNNLNHKDLQNMNAKINTPNAHQDTFANCHSLHYFHLTTPNSHNWVLWIYRALCWKKTLASWPMRLNPFIFLFFSYWKMPHVVTDVRYACRLAQYFLFFYSMFIHYVPDVKGPSNLANWFYELLKRDAARRLLNQSEMFSASRLQSSCSFGKSLSRDFLGELKCPTSLI